MTEDDQGRHRRRKRPAAVGLVLVAVMALLAVVVVAPLVSLNRYKSRITGLMAASLGRPVRLSSVELRLLPRPGFVLYDLTVDEDPAYGTEPVLHASTVTASIRLLSVWSGRLAISSISVDDASLNLVRTADGQWNLDPLFRTAAVNAGAAGVVGTHRPAPLPYLEATNSRINIKNGLEKLPYSLLDTDLSFWQDQPGEWRIRLRGQPARTDLIVQGADTGVVRLEASVHRAPELRQMPVHLDLDWRDAQLGQLSRLLIGSDPGWRGDLTGELHLDGTPDAAQIKSRLRATGVHRAEFAPAAPMDFDANCGFVYHYSQRTVENLVCDSPLGDGRVRLAGDHLARGVTHFSVELDRIPVAAGLDALRTLRSGFGPGLEATGDISGKISYAETAQVNSEPQQPATTARPGKILGFEPHATGLHAAQAGPLTGSFTVERLQLSGDGLHQPILIPKLVLEPVASAIQGQKEGGSQFAAEHAVLAATVAVPAGGTAPLTVTTRLGLSGYQLTAHGPAALARARELAHVAGMGDASVLDALAGDAVTIDLTAEGPWMEAEMAPLSNISSDAGMSGPLLSKPAKMPASGDALTDRLSGTVTLHNANWKSDYLANHVEILQATLHLDRVGEETGLRWDPLVFSYGPVKGTAIITLPASCAVGEACPPHTSVHFQVEFGALDAAALQAAILGAHEKGTMLSELIARLSPSSPAPAWPELEGTVKAEALILGPVRLDKPSALVHIQNNGAEITDLNAELLGGSLHGTGTLTTGESTQRLPNYALTGSFEKISPGALGQLLGQHWTGGVLEASGKIALQGFTGKDLASSAKGELHFVWKHGALSTRTGVSPVRFERWTGEAEIANGTIVLKQNEMLEGPRKQGIDASVQLEDPPSFSMVPSRETQTKH
ncbi:MAG: AsmA family protein [Terracidiphilus sp.]